MALSIEETYGIIVVGGGPAGSCAAIASARSGARTLLVDRHDFLGGVAAAAMFQPWRGFHSLGKTLVNGIGAELVEKLETVGGSPGHQIDPTGVGLTVTPFDPELLKSALFELAESAGVTTLLRSNFSGAIAAGGLIEKVEIRTPNGNKIFRAGVYIDATGDGCLAAAAGAKWLKHDSSASCRFSMENVDERVLLGYAMKNPHEFSKAPSSTDVPYLSVKGFTSLTRRWHHEAPILAGFDAMQFEGTTREGELVIAMIELGNVNPDDPDGLERAAIRCADLAHRGAQFLSDNCPGFEGASLKKLAPELGFHSTRQILGRRPVTDSDVLSGRNFTEAAATCVMPGRPDCTYQVPVDALRLPAIENLIVTGRGILPPTALFATNAQAASMELGEFAGRMGAELNRKLNFAG